jgi:hypothetical protein
MRLSLGGIIMSTRQQQMIIQFKQSGYSIVPVKENNQLAIYAQKANVETMILLFVIKGGNQHV